MIEYTEQVVEKTERIATFYCDRCKTFLGKSVELEDGYFYPFGTYRKNFYFEKIKKSISIDLTLCEDCAALTETKIADAIKEIILYEGEKE